MAKQTLGELNGKWTLLFKVAMAMIPFCLAYVGYVHASVRDLTHSVSDIRVAVASIQANRFTSEHGLEVWKEIAEIQKTIAALPPDRFEDKVQKIADDVQLILQDLAVLKERQ